MPIGRLATISPSSDFGVLPKTRVQTMKKGLFLAFQGHHRRKFVCGNIQRNEQ